jgi:hypothetical protein
MSATIQADRRTSTASGDHAIEVPDQVLLDRRRRIG